jgi:hypothetical protein
MAFDAQRSRRSRLVMMMGGAIVLSGRMLMA